MLFNGGASANAEKILAPLEMHALAAIAFGVFVPLEILAGVLHHGDYRVAAVGELRFCNEIGIYDIRLVVHTVYILVVSVSQLKDPSFYINELIKVAFFVLFSWRRKCLREQSS